MAATELIAKTYRPSMTAGQLYARAWGQANAPMLEVGNVLELTIEHKEDVQSQADMTRLGGGVHAQVRRVTEVEISMKIADLNVRNLARATLGTIHGTDAGSATDEAHTLTARGALIALAQVGATEVTLKKGASAGAAQVVAAAKNYEVRPEGLFILPTAPDLTPGDKLWVSYQWGDQVSIEALTAAAAELQLRFGGLNEADGGRACVVDIWRASQSITKQLALINDGFGSLEVTGSVLVDPSRSGQGTSRYYRQTLVG